MGREKKTCHEEGALTLDGLAVLHYSIDLPNLAHLGRGGGRMTRYYTRLADRLKRRWQGEGYVLSCLDYAFCNETAKEFIPWQGGLAVEEIHQEGEEVTIVLQYTEGREGKIVQIPLTDHWILPWGCPKVENKPKLARKKK